MKCLEKNVELILRLRLLEFDELFKKRKMIRFFAVLLFVLSCGSACSDSVPSHDQQHVPKVFVTDISGAVISVEHEALAGPGVFLILKENTDVFFWTLADAKALLSLISCNPDASKKLKHLTILLTFLDDKKFIFDAGASHEVVLLFKQCSIEPKKLSDVGGRWSIALPVAACDVSSDEEVIEHFVDLSCLDQKTGDVLTNPECMPAQRIIELKARSLGASRFPFLYILPAVKDPLFVSKREQLKVPGRTPRPASLASLSLALKIVGSVGLIVGGLVVADRNREALAEQKRVTDELAQPPSVRLVGPRRCVTPALDRGFFVVNGSPQGSPRCASPVGDEKAEIELDLTLLDVDAMENDSDGHWLAPKETWVFQKPSFRGKHPKVILKRCCAIPFELDGKKWCFTVEQCRLAWQALETKKTTLKQTAAQEFNAIILDCLEKNTDSYWQQVVDLFKLLGQEPTECS